MWNLIGVAVLAVVAVVASLGWAESARSLALEKSRHADAFATYRFKTGGTVLWPGSRGAVLNYNLMSMDSGANWVALEVEAGGGRKVIGPAEEVYPGLLAQLAGLDALTNRVQISGSLKLSDPDAVALLERSGLSVSQQPVE